MSAAYPSPINEIPELRGAFNEQRFPAARQVAETLLTIPVHEWVSETDKHAIAASLLGASGRVFTADKFDGDGIPLHAAGCCTS